MAYFPGLARLSMLGTAASKDGHGVPDGTDMLSGQLHSNCIQIAQAPTVAKGPITAQNF